MWVTELKLMPTSPTHKFKPLYTRPTFFPISLLVSFFFNIWFLGFGALFLHAEKNAVDVFEVDSKQNTCLLNFHILPGIRQDP